MKANELRIGNMVRFKDTNEPSRIYQLEHRFRGTYRINDLNDNDQLEYMPVSGKMFIQFGFERDLSGPTVYTRDDISIFVNQGNVVGLANGKYYASFGHRNVVTIEYMHQLQNLYFALTNKELTHEKQP